MINILFTDVMIMAVINDEFLMVQLHFQWRVSGLFVGSHERRKHTVLLIEENLWFIKLQNDASLHHNHQVCIQDGVHTMLWKHTQRLRLCLSSIITSIQSSSCCQTLNNQVRKQPKRELTAMVTTVLSAKAVITTFCRMLSY